METAKVDIKKLQILSDRINQCIDALNQVRISVHGLSPSNPFSLGAFGQGAFGAPGFGQSPGLSHSSPFNATPLGMGSPGIPYANPYSSLGAGAFSGIGQTGFGQTGFGPMGFGAGLSHTSPEGTEPYPGSAWNDPYLAARITQTFPYLKLAVPPIVTLY